MNRSAIAAGLVLAAGSVLAIQTSGSARSTVARGEFSEFAVGAADGMDISGRATLTRTDDGHTVVTIRVRGLVPGTTYAAHVHAAPCGTGEADGHYMHDPGGPPTPPNEIWPGPVTANAGGVARGTTTADFVAGESAVSVVIHRPGPTPNKIACADLL
jgi:Cu-Zn family superoxide dismutase